MRPRYNIDRLVDRLAEAIATFTVQVAALRAERQTYQLDMLQLQRDIKDISGRLQAVTVLAEMLADLSDERYLMLKTLMPKAEEPS